MSRIQRTCLILLLLLSTVLPLGPNLAWSYEEDLTKNIIMAEKYYAYIRSLHLLNVEDLTPGDMERIVFDIERRISEVEQMINLAELFDSPPTGIRALKLTLAKMYLQLAYFSNMAPDFDKAAAALKSASKVYPGIYEGRIEVELRGVRHFDFGKNISEYEIVSASAFKSLVEGAWQQAKYQRFIISEYTHEDLRELTIQSAIYQEENSLGQKILKIANQKLKDNIARGETSFDILLELGRYRLVQEGQPKISYEFMIYEGQTPDPLNISPYKLKIQFKENYFELTPKFYLNGVRREPLDNLPFGVYTLVAAPELFIDPPAKIRFSYGQGKVEKGKAVWDVPLPKEGVFILDLEKKPLSKRLFGIRPEVDR